MATRWWLEMHAAQLAARGDYKAAYEARLEVPFHIIEVERDSYAQELEAKVVRLETENEHLRDALAEARHAEDDS